ncbi:MAG: hypothetical protein ACYS76_16300 [Planctomycetota bacterium]|jgi:hypothetical protein
MEKCKECGDLKPPWWTANEGNCKCCGVPLKGTNLIAATNIITFQKDGLFCIWGDLLACSPECLLAMAKLAVERTD